ncbi:V-type proton ATPase subunit a3 [Cucurbita argyrosperma subsp. argyrosperma]|nr:V-type proton ATPase subunit a3 [Cucurbita argyrosperma subsp. argyrosperma]
MDLLLSEAMQLVHLIISNESAHRMISYLGLFQFKYYLNASRSPFQRTYAAQVKLGEFEAESLEINDNNEKLQRNWSEQLEDKLVLQRRHGMFLLIRSYYNSVGLAIVKLTSEFQVEKNVFVIFYSGERAKDKILKICGAFAMLPIH